MKLYNWNADKNTQLIKERGKSFEEVIFFIENGGLLDEIAHPNKTTYPNQRMFIVAIDGYVYVIPFVEDDSEIFLKTIIPSRKFTKRYFGEDI